MTTAAELETGTARTATPPGAAAGISTGTPGTGTLARGTAGTGAGDGSTPKTGLQAHKPDADAGTVATLAAGPAETSTGRGAAIGTATPEAETTGKTSTAPPTARKPTATELLAGRTPRRCLNHTDPADWQDEPARHRPGYILTTCRRCGGFLGYRSAETGTRKGDRR